MSTKDTFDPKAFDDRMALQNAEFDAVTELGKQWRRLQMTAVVDDDYPEVRHDYDSAMRALLRAVRKNWGEDYWRIA